LKTILRTSLKLNLASLILISDEISFDSKLKK